MENELNFKISPEIYPLEKEKENKETIWEYYFARKIAFLILPIFLKTKISANQISILSIFFGIFGTILIALGNFWQILLGAILLQIWLILDKTDGLVARYRKSISSLGKFLEELNGTIIAALFFSSTGFAASKLPGFLPFQFKLPLYFFIIFGILTSFFIIFRHLIFRHFEAIFFTENKSKAEYLISTGRLSIFYKIALKFLGIYSLAQPLLIFAIIFNFLGLYTLVYFIIQGIAMLTTISLLVYRASKI
jgi:phosphatidylglycerophosphate synthase